MTSNDALPPPIPPPGGDVCPNCDAPVDFRNEFCAHCGARLRKAKKLGFWGFVPMWIIGWLSSIFGGFGACSLFFAVPNLNVYSSDFFSHRDAVALAVTGILSGVLSIVLYAVAARKARR